jgi:hypothetical protein
MKYLIIVFIAVFFVSCSNDRWTKNEKFFFIQSCREEGGSKDYCDCYMKNIMANFPIAEDANDIDFEIKIELSKDCKE